MGCTSSSAHRTAVPSAPSDTPPSRKSEGESTSAQKDYFQGDGSTSNVTSMKVESIQSPTDPDPSPPSDRPVDVIIEKDIDESASSSLVSAYVRTQVMNYLDLDPNLFVQNNIDINPKKALSLQWQQKTTSNHASVSLATVSESSWKAVKAESYLSVSIEDVVALLLNDLRASEYDEMVDTVKVLSVDGKLITRQVCSKTIWPVSPREFISQSTWSHLADGSILTCTTSSPSPPSPPSAGFTRGFIHCAAYWIQPKDSLSPSEKSFIRTPEGCKLTLLAHTDLGGSVPASIVNMLSTTTPLKVMAAIQRTLTPSSRAPVWSAAASDQDKFLRQQLQRSSERRLRVKEQIASMNKHVQVVTIDSCPLEVSAPAAPPVNEQSTPLFDSPRGEPLPCTGYMLKQGQVVKSWKRRYFVLNRGVLTYYESEFSGKVVGEPINLRGYHVSSPASLSLSLYRHQRVSLAQPHVDEEDVDSAGRILFLRLESVDNHEKWLVALMNHIYFRDSLPVPASCTGFMLKQGRLIKSIKRRFFILEEGTLSYFDDENGSKDMHLKGEPMSLVACTVSSPQLNHILVTSSSTPHGGRQLLLQCDDGDETARWITAIQQHILFIESR